MSRKSNGEKKPDQNVAVAIDKDKGSQFALKWVVDQLLSRGQTLTLLHVKPKSSSSSSSSSIFNQSSSEGNDDNGKSYKQLDGPAKELFLPFRCFCTRKEIKVNEVVVEDGDIAKAITEYVSVNIVDTLILGAPSRSGLIRKFKITDVPSTVSKSAPDFCTVYVITKGKILSVRSASCSPPPKPSPPTQNVLQNKGSSANNNDADLDPIESYFNKHNQPYRSVPMQSLQEEIEIKSPFNRGRNSIAKSYGSSPPDNDISFVSSGRPSMDRMPPFNDSYDSGLTPWISTNTERLSNISEHDFKNFGSLCSGNRSSMDFTSHQDYSSSSTESGKAIWSSQNLEDVEAEMRRLRLELKQTMDMYSSACKEALTAKQKTRELQRWKLEEQQKLEDARLAEEAALALVEKEKAKSKAAIEAAQAAQRLAELESQKRINTELKAMRDADERNKAMHSMNHVDIRYRKYSIEEIEAAAEDFAAHLKIGEGGYGPVYKAYLDHTQVAIKVLRPDAAQGRSQFQQEVEVLSCIRHPNMVLLLGACPEYGCLVYEYMANGSLDDRLFRRGGTPPLSWQVRFRIAAEIATGLLFLHQTKPEPLVHRDLKPGNILLDRNYVSKISDVGLARLVPPSVADSVTQYRMTSTAGTFCYIDPEYQQTGMLGIKSDIYSLGIMLLQIITAKPPMGLTHHVERAIEKGTFRDVLDQTVSDWPYEETLLFAKIALQCAELRKKDRPDLGKLVLPELNRLRALGEESMPNVMFVGNANSSPNHIRASSIQEMMSGPDSGYGYESSKSRSSTSPYGGRR